MLLPIKETAGVILDIRYASDNNFVGRAVYARPVALLHREAHAAFVHALARAQVLGLGFRIFDAFRPIEVQSILWDAVSDKTFVADPALGGTHPRGIALDLTLFDLATGEDLPMGTGFDAVTPLSAHGALEGLSAEVIRNRALLLGLMSAAGWDSYEPEWWHYNLPDGDALPVLSAADVPEGPL
ncbi:D-alanyl-D-alanine dipeptidase [Novacetimonas hansenii]|uniref:D-alanyl-D-alanine dipeptidase n=1 Tax=Novacetimonas hansenii TaxID=436 RepID=UPI000789B24A|nr:D-alanyl-D-alanine dipeptidase [Novacetimonas hansenii]RFP04202.1 D-alanyl-D-alanine dipeptidase [Novacetimonas hansenii]WEQ59712.1 D-alanyl-D-alanine dipeptidase [Novacetimonas hansenii]CUW47795.1 D-alanyl-D-alanine dipeptidase [Novacetimonas hansenii]